MARKDKNVTPSVTHKLQSLGYNVADWDDSQTASKLSDEIKQVLNNASKKENLRIGYPDRIFVDKHNKLLILVEEKSSIKDHENPNKERGAISGIKWYLSRFFNSNLKNNLRNYFNDWKILGIGVSGDLMLEYQHKFSCYTIDSTLEKIIPLNQVTNFMSAQQFLAIFNSLDEEEAVTKVSSSSKKINNLLRSVDSQKRPVLLSALMICLHKVGKNSENYINDFPDHYKTYQPATIINRILETVKNVLKVEGIPDEKLKALSTELAFLSTDQTLNNTSILKDILIELETAVIPLFKNQFASNSNYDIIGKFYEEFLKYAGVSNVKKGIVLTPRHITTLFTKLIDLKDNDKIVDICCGTGAFLIAGMNALIAKISSSNRSDKDMAIKKVKESQLLGFELNPTMYICAISNMLFRGDGKSSIFNYDSIRNSKAQDELDKFKATIGFINPPYSGKENKDDPTPKEITFLVKMLDNCSRYGIIIAPLSTYFKEENLREQILKKHTLKYVINMPGELFQPNASTHTAIAVFETNRSFDYNNDQIVFYDLRDDGFVLAKTKGRTDIYGKWSSIEQQLLDSLKHTSIPNETTLVRTKIKPKDEWTIYAHSKTDYSKLSEKDFINSISDYMIFQAKKDLGILFSDITEMDVFEAIGNYFSNNQGIKISTKNERKYLPIDMTNWKEFSFIDKKLWTKIKHGLRLIESDRIKGEIPYYSASEFNNSLTDNIENPLFIEKDSIVYSTFGTAFWVSGEFTASDEIYAFHNPNLNKYNALFVTTIMKQNQYKFKFGRKAFMNKFKNEIIKLPATPDGNPDWLFMENFIKSLPYSDNI